MEPADPLPPRARPARPAPSAPDRSRRSRTGYRRSSTTAVRRTTCRSAAPRPPPPPMPAPPRPSVAGRRRPGRSRRAPPRRRRRRSRGCSSAARPGAGWRGRPPRSPEPWWAPPGSGSAARCSPAWGGGRPAPRRGSPRPRRPARRPRRPRWHRPSATCRPGAAVPEERVRITTSWPRESRSAAIRRPSAPVPPARTTFTGSSPPRRQIKATLSQVSPDLRVTKMAVPGKSRPRSGLHWPQIRSCPSGHSGSTRSISTNPAATSSRTRSPRVRCCST